MIKVSNLNKYYNKGKSNELHVINNCTLEFPNTGLITLFGQSGSGKTTLLNVIGGLDRATGDIEYNDVKVHNYNMGRQDKFRKDRIGYIFQNYNLLNNLSVTDNLRLALEISNISDKKEQDKRIEYALKAVKLYKYRKKLAGELSGGQQQRVSIARALVKDFELLIADEPTGNLDSTNSIQIMNILKSISKTKLVILVTHSKELAEYYSDKIIELKDGTVTQVRDPENVSLSKSRENKVFLGELNKTTVENNNVSFEVYSKDNKDINVRLVEVNGTFYLESNVKVVPYNNQVQIIDGDYKEEDIKEETEEFIYDTSSFNEGVKKNLFSGVKEIFLANLRRNRFQGKKKRIFKAIFLVIGVVLAILNVNFARATKTDDSKVLTSLNSSMLMDKEGYIRNENIVNYYKKGSINSYIPLKEVDLSFLIARGSYESTKISEKALATVGYDIVDSNTLVVGNFGGAVIGKKLASKIMTTSKSKSYEELLVYLNNYSYQSQYTYQDMKITGIINEDTDMLYENFPTSTDYNLETSKVMVNQTGDTSKIETQPTVSLTSKLDTSKMLYGASVSSKNGDFVISKSFFGDTFDSSLYTSTSDVLSKFDIYVGNTKINDKIVGIVDDNSNTFYLGENDYRVILSRAGLGFESFFNEDSSISYDVFSTTKDSNIETVKESTYKIKSYYQIQIDNIKQNKKSQTLIYLIVSLVLSSIIVIYLFFTMRTQIITDINQIGVLRSIGTLRRKFYLNYGLDIVFTVFKTVFITYVITTIIEGLIYNKIAQLTNQSFNLFLIPSTYYIFFVLLVLAVLIGLLPLYLLLRKTPSEILAKYDI